MHSVFLSGCVRQGWSQGCLHSWARWILTPSLLSTLPCFMSPAVLIFYTLFNSLPYNIHLYNKPRVTVKNWPWNERRAVVLWRAGISGKCGVVISFSSLIVGGQSQTTKVWITRRNLFSELCVIGPVAYGKPIISYLPCGHGPLGFNYERATDRYAH